MWNRLSENVEIGLKRWKCEHTCCFTRCECQELVGVIKCSTCKHDKNSHIPGAFLPNFYLFFLVSRLTYTLHSTVKTKFRVYDTSINVRPTTSVAAIAWMQKAQNKNITTVTDVLKFALCAASTHDTK